MTQHTEIKCTYCRHVRVDVGADYYVFTVRVATGGEMKQGLLGFSAAQVGQLEYSYDNKSFKLVVLY